MKALVKELQRNKLEYKNATIGKVSVEFEFKLTTKTMEGMSNKVVLSIDEALDAEAADRSKLRFLRNLGRAMGMRVVLAGTAATAANMIAEDKDEKSASRTGEGGNAWVEVAFLWQVMDEETMDTILPESVLKKISLPESSSVNYTVLKNAIRMEHPLVAVLIRRILEEWSDQQVKLMTVRLEESWIGTRKS